MLVFAFFSPPSSMRTRRAPPSSTCLLNAANCMSVKFCRGQPSTTNPALARLAFVSGSDELKHIETVDVAQLEAESKLSKEMYTQLGAVVH